MLKAIAIDDEPLALEVIKSHASKVSFISLQKNFTNAFEALDYMQDNPVDLIFLDIKMPDISGMEFATLPAKKPMIIFTTAYSEHAVKSFELDAIDYLLKPFSLARFTKACTKANELWMLKNQKRPDKVTSLFLKTGYEQVKVLLDDILFLEASGNYVTFQTIDSKIMTRMTFQEAENLLPEDFCRIHRSFIVHKSKIDKVERHQLSLGKHTVPIGSSYADNLNLNPIN
ncbi:response regulator transcription factor [Echinicola sp. CAU 1574]|uniref:Response regulator transcription factor n=1 Tax=Echinicola arenosa TaxID=2774144 RepID=A0ABR9ARP6_9BACT|nr:LytTR family DNA-binding domain-containing protein [Echinicola arenosa]MBD8490548.1 response regulator transcription factor [Echinicola arenosa]